jgi:rare lipoprotein A
MRMTGAMRSIWRSIGLGLFLAFVATGCAETELASYALKSASQHPTGTYKVGSPYKIDGVWYYPAEDFSYAESGVASWYGEKFHGRTTANGEIYDMNGLTAAHRTLPMPSFVRVTNLENGRSINLRVNDRGPFARGRIIDLSRRAAQLLGFALRGTAKVRVEILETESRQAALMAQRRMTGENEIEVAAVPRVAVAAQSLPLPGSGEAVAPPPPAPVESAAVSAPTAMMTEPQVTETVTVGPVLSSRIYVQAGAFALFDNANRTRARLSGLGPTIVEQVDQPDITLFRVRVGPVDTVAEADRMLAMIAGAGYPEARIIVD